MFIGPASELGRLLFADEAAASGWAAEWQATPALQEAYDKNRYAAAKYTWQPRLYNPKLGKWLHRIDVPTHVIWGEEDRLIRRRMPRPWPPKFAAPSGRCCRNAGISSISSARSFLPTLSPLHRKAAVMKVMFFHLMPYADLDLDYQQNTAPIGDPTQHLFRPGQKATRSTTAISTNWNWPPSSVSMACR